MAKCGAHQSKQCHVCPCSQVTWHSTARTNQPYSIFDHEMRTPLVNLTPRPELKGNMWPALAAVPWQCWAAEGDGFQCSRLWRQDKLAILARHWNILPVLGLPLPPPRERLPACLTNHSVARIVEEAAEIDVAGGAQDPEEYYSESESGDEVEKESDEEEVEEKEEEAEVTGRGQRQAKRARN